MARKKTVVRRKRKAADKRKKGGKIMSDRTLIEHSEKIRQVSMALGMGHLDAVLNKKAEIMALRPKELDRIVTLLGSIEAACNECCTGG